MNVLAYTNHFAAFFKIELVIWLDAPIFTDSTATFTFYTLHTIAALSALYGSHVSKNYSEKNAFMFLITSSTLTCTDTKSERR